MSIINSVIRTILVGIYAIVGDYGIAIIGVTLFIRFILLPLSIKQRKSLSKQQAVSEKVNQIKEKYKGNTAKINEETSKYLQSNGIGATGCLLSLLQLPIMFSLNSVIRGSIGARSTTMLLPWISSLGVKDPYFILPVCTIIIQLLPQIFPYLKFFKKLNLAKGKQSMILYLVFINGIFAITIPSGIDLYWMISGLYSFLEELVYHLFSLRKIRRQQGCTGIHC